MSKQIVITKKYHDTGEPPTTGYAISPYNHNRYNQAGNFVAAEITSTAKRGPAQLLPVQDTSHALDIPLSATQHIEMRTSAVDRAKGFLIASIPLYAGLALLALLVSIFFAGVPFLSLSALCIFWGSFVLAWLAGYAYTLSRSAEGTAHWEAKAKWRIIAEEQRRRWDYYERLGGE